MDLKFTNWYTQALGATFGIIASIYAYLNGFMFVYGNINRHFDYLGFDGVISSYFLIPLCVFTLILSVIKPYTESKTFINISFSSINKGVAITTIIIGFMGAKIYFTIPAILIVFHLISYKLIKNSNNELIDDGNLELSEVDNGNSKSIDEKKAKLSVVKKEIAIELLNKNADIEFIKDITGLNEEEIYNISN